jgi:glycosyltransferase involved in cell wall biosynthesis
MGTQPITSLRSSAPKRAASTSIHQVLVSREFGGAADIAIKLACQAQQDLGERQHVWLPGIGRAWNRAAAFGFQLHRYDSKSAQSTSMVKAAWGNTRFALQLLAAKPGMVHVHDPVTYAALRHGLRMARVPAIVHVQIDYPIEDLQWAFRLPPQAVVVCADFLHQKVLDSLPKTGRRETQVVTVRNAVDVQRFVPTDKRKAKQQLGWNADQPMVLMLANLAKHKGQATTIRAIAELHRQGIDVRCSLAGVDRSVDGTYEKFLRALCEVLRVSHLVDFLGFRSDTVELLQGADLLLLPSTHEGLPLTVLEAQATGVPVLAAPTAGIPEIIRNHVSGRLIDASDYQAYAMGIRQLLENRTTYDEIAKAAREHCLCEHSWSNLWNQMRQVYASVHPQTSQASFDV